MGILIETIINSDYHKNLKRLEWMKLHGAFAMLAYVALIIEGILLAPIG
jgi:hypothetical protein